MSLLFCPLKNFLCSIWFCVRSNNKKAIENEVFFAKEIKICQMVRFRKLNKVEICVDFVELRNCKSLKMLNECESFRIFFFSFLTSSDIDGRLYRYFFFSIFDLVFFLGATRIIFSLRNLFSFEKNRLNIYFATITY